MPAQLSYSAGGIQVRSKERQSVIHLPSVHRGKGLIYSEVSPIRARL
jgi:hypothetical protein